MEREQLIDAFTRVAAERGWTKTTVDDVATAAGLPPAAFYEHFSSKRQCLGAAYDSFIERLLAESLHATKSGQDWALRVKAAVAACLDFIGETASRARFFAVEALAAGPMVLERDVSAIGRLVPFLREGRKHFPEAAELPELTEAVLIGGIAFLITGALLSEDHTCLPGMQAQLVEILLTPYLGRKMAKQIAA